MKSYKYNRHTIGALCLSVICHLLLWGVVSYFHQPPIEHGPPLIPLGGLVPSWEPRHLPRPVKSGQAAAPRVMVIGRVQVTVPMKRRVSVGSGLESADPMETLATPMEAAELLPSAGASHSGGGAGELLEGLSSGEGVSDLTPRVDADQQQRRSPKQPKPQRGDR